MPILPLDRPEPFAATLGVMIYPGTGEIEQRQARAFASQYLAEPIRRLYESGRTLSIDTLAQIVVDAGEPLHDCYKRSLQGNTAGELFKAFYILSKDHPELASWDNAIRIYQKVAARDGTSGSRTHLWNTRSEFLTAAHLWGAWSIREGRFHTQPEIGYDGYADFQSFLREAEILRDWGQNWRHSRAKAEPPLPLDVWQVPKDWQPPQRQPGWPLTGVIPDLALPEELLATLKPSGRPPKHA